MAVCARPPQQKELETDKDVSLMLRLCGESIEKARKQASTHKEGARSHSGSGQLWWLGSTRGDGGGEHMNVKNAKKMR